MILRHYEYIVKTDERYPQTLLFKFRSFPANRLAPYSIGDKVRVTFEISGWQNGGKYYVGLNGKGFKRIGKPFQWKKKKT